MNVHQPATFEVSEAVCGDAQVLAKATLAGWTL